MLRTFVQVTALFFSGFSSFFWIKSIVTMSINEMIESASVDWSGISGLPDNLCKQRADAVVAAVFLSISLLLQAVNLLWPMTIDELGGLSIKGILWAIVVSILAFAVGFWGSKELYRNQAKKVRVRGTSGV